MPAPMIACLGGTFDPVHNGHLFIAQEVCKAINPDQLRFIPAATPVHRDTPAANATARLAMLQAAIAASNEPRFVVDTFELNAQNANYTHTTLAALRHQLPAASLIWIIGDDAFALLPTWHRWQELFDLAHFVVVTRDHNLATPTDLWKNRETADLTRLRVQSAGCLYRLHVSPHPASATRIRAALKQGADVSHLLPPAVLTYIADHHLYS